jgi:transcriptional regulator
MNQNEYLTIKIWKTTHHLLKVLCAVSGESILELLDRLLRQEAEKVGVAVPEKTL